MPLVVRRFTGRTEGDLRIDAEPVELAARRAALAPHPWTWLHQVHGAEVVRVTEPGEHAGAAADAAVTDRPWAVLAVQTADCAPVLLADEAAGVIGVAHAGWRGLVAGVLPATVAAMEDLGASRITAQVGPCIRPGCYAFGAEELDRVAAVGSDAVRSTTTAGNPALDLAAGVEAVLLGAGVAVVDDVGGCTACDPRRWYSHRARAEAGRQAGLIWIEP